MKNSFFVLYLVFSGKTAFKITGLPSSSSILAGSAVCSPSRVNHASWYNFGLYNDDFLKLRYVSQYFNNSTMLPDTILICIKTTFEIFATCLIVSCYTAPTLPLFLSFSKCVCRFYKIYLTSKYGLDLCCKILSRLYWLISYNNIF